MRRPRRWRCSCWPLPLLLGVRAAAAAATREVEQGNAALKAGKAEEALEHYDKAVAKLPADAGRALRSRRRALRAVALRRGGRRSSCARPRPRTAALKASAFYNLGNAFFKKEKFKEAVEAYKRTLALDPRDERAKWNLEIALAQAEGQRRRRSRTRRTRTTRDKDKDDKKDDQKKDDKDKTRRQGRPEEGRQDKDKDKQDKKDQKTRRTSRTSRSRTSSSRSRRRPSSRRAAADRSRCSTTSSAAPRISRRSGPGCAPCAAARRRGTGRRPAGAPRRPRARRLAAASLLARPGRAAPRAARRRRSSPRSTATPSRPASRSSTEVTLTSAATTRRRLPAARLQGSAACCQARRSPASRPDADRRSAATASMQSSYTWRYELMLPAGAKGPLTIGAAHVRVGGRELRSNTVTVRVGAAGAASRAPGGPPRVGPNRLFRRLFRRRRRSAAIGEAPGGRLDAGAGVHPRRRRQDARLRRRAGDRRLVPLPDRAPNKFEPVTEPRTDGFWSEDIPSTNPQGRLAFTSRRRWPGALPGRAAVQEGAVSAAPGQADDHARWRRRSRRSTSSARRCARSASRPSRWSSRRCRCRARASPPGFDAGQRRAATSLRRAPIARRSPSARPSR